MTLTDHLANTAQTYPAAQRRLAKLAAEQATAGGQRATEIARAIRREQRRLDRASEALRRAEAGARGSMDAALPHAMTRTALARQRRLDTLVKTALAADAAVIRATSTAALLQRAMRRPLPLDAWRKLGAALARAEDERCNAERLLGSALAGICRGPRRAPACVARAGRAIGGSRRDVV